MELVAVVVAGVVAAAADAPMIRPPYGADRIFRASRRSRRCCITKRNWSNLVLVLLFSISTLLHFVQIGWIDAVGLADSDDDDDTVKSPVELRKSNALDADEFRVEFDRSSDWFGDTIGVTGAELVIGIWHWRQSMDVFADTGVVGNDADFDVDGWPESLVT